MNFPSRAGEIFRRRNGRLAFSAEVTGREDAVFWEVSQEIPAEAGRSAFVDLWIRCLDGQYVLLRANATIFRSANFAAVIWCVAERRDLILAQKALRLTAQYQTLPTSTLRTDDGQTWLFMAAETAGRKFVIVDTEAEVRKKGLHSPTLLPDAPHKHTGLRTP